MPYFVLVLSQLHGSIQRRRAAVEDGLEFQGFSRGSLLVFISFLKLEGRTPAFALSSTSLSSVVYLSSHVHPPVRLDNREYRELIKMTCYTKSALRRPLISSHQEELTDAFLVKERPQGDDRNEAMRWQWLYV